MVGIHLLIHFQREFLRRYMALGEQAYTERKVRFLDGR